MTRPQKIACAALVLLFIGWAMAPIVAEFVGARR